MLSQEQEAEESQQFGAPQTLNSSQNASHTKSEETSYISFLQSLMGDVANQITLQRDLFKDYSSSEGYNEESRQWLLKHIERLENLKNRYHFVLESLSPHNLNDKLIARAHKGNFEGPEYISLKLIDNDLSLHDPDSLPGLSNITRSSDSNLIAERPAEVAPSTIAHPVQDTIVPISPRIKSNGSIQRRSRDRREFPGINSSFVSKVVENINSIYEHMIDRFAHTRETKGYCQHETCENFIAELDAFTAKQQSSLRHLDMIHPPHSCGQLSHVIGDIILSIFRVFPSDPVKMYHTFQKYFPEETLEIFTSMAAMKAPYYPCEIFIAPDASKLFMPLIAPVISVGGAFLKKHSYGNYIVFVAVGVSANYKAHPIAMGIYSAKNIENYSNFLGQLSEVYKDYFDKYKPIFLSDGGNAIRSAVFQKFDGARLYHCVRHLQNRIPHLKLLKNNGQAPANSSEKKRLKEEAISLLYQLQYITNDKTNNKNFKKLASMLEKPSKSDSAYKSLNDFFLLCYSASERSRFNQTTSNSFDFLSKYLLDIRAQGSWNIIQRVMTLAQAQIDAEIQDFYKGRHAGCFMYDTEYLIPGVIFNLSHSLMHIDDYNIKFDPSDDNSYCVYHKPDSLLLLYMKKSRDFIPSEVPGLYHCYHSPYSYSTTNSRLLRLNESHSKACYRVNLESKTCSCNYFQQLQYPCIHALAVIMKEQRKVSDYCAKMYHLKTASGILKTYQKKYRGIPDFHIHEKLYAKSLSDLVPFGIGGGALNTPTRLPGRPSVRPSKREYDVSDSEENLKPSKKRYYLSKLRNLLDYEVECSINFHEKMYGPHPTDDSENSDNHM